MTDYEDESKNRWKAAVIDALVVDCIYRKEHEDDPRNALNELCAWEQKIALDPAVSSDARALIERGRKEASPAGGKWMPERDALLRAWADRCGISWDDERALEPHLYGWPDKYAIFRDGWDAACLAVYGREDQRDSAAGRAGEGDCGECLGKGDVPYSWSVTGEEKTRPCKRCNGTGRREVTP